MKVSMRCLPRVSGLVLLLACWGATGGALAAAPATLTLEFTTVPTGGKYSPRHVLAVWVTDAQTNFVKTLCRYGLKRHKYLTAWRQAGGNPAGVDGVTGATRKSHDVVRVTWDGCDAQGQPLPDGLYLFFVEFAEAHEQGPVAVLPVRKGPTAQVTTFPDSAHFIHIKVRPEPGPS